MPVVPVLAAIVAIAGAVAAILATDSRLTTAGTAAALLAAPFVADPLPQPLGLSVRLVGAGLAAYLLWTSMRQAAPLLGPLPLAGRGEAAFVLAAAAIGFLADAVTSEALGPTAALAAGGALLVAGLDLLAFGEDGLRLGSGALLALTGASLVLGGTGRHARRGPGGRPRGRHRGGRRGGGVAERDDAGSPPRDAAGGPAWRPARHRLNRRRRAAGDTRRLHRGGRRGCRGLVGGRPLAAAANRHRPRGAGRVRRAGAGDARWWPDPLRR